MGSVILGFDCPDRGHRVQGGPAGRRTRSVPPTLDPAATHLDLGAYEEDDGGGLGFGGVAEPRKVLIDWDYGAHGIWWVLTKEEREASAPPGRWSGVAPPHPHQRRPWSDRLWSELLNDLQEWNDAWDSNDADIQTLQERGRDLAIRVQDELGTDGWEVLYKLGGQVRRVHPPGSWPALSWTQQLLGYAPRRT